MISNATIKRKFPESNATSAFDSDHAQVYLIFCLATKMAAFIVEEEERERAFRRERVFKDRSDPLDEYSDEELFKKYRFSRVGILHILGLLGDDLDHPTSRNHALPAVLQLLTALNFFATGAVFDSVASMHGIHRSSVSRSVHNVAEALCRLKNNVSSPYYY